MNLILSENLVNALAWTVLHSLWQGLLIGGCFFLLKKVLPHNPKRHFWIATIGLYLLFGVVMTTFLGYFIWNSKPNTLSQIDFNEMEVVVLAMEKITQPSSSNFMERLESILNPHLDRIAFIWWIGMLFFLCRFLLGAIFIEYIKRFRVQKLPEHWQESGKKIAQTLNVDKNFTIGTSKLVNSPMVVGVIKPIILLPIGILTQLTITELEVVLAHEIAHIKRNDYLLNLIQGFIEVLLYFNPAIWWFSNWIREEREYCCDDLVVDHPNKAMIYAKALLKLQENSNLETIPGNLRVALISKPKVLLNRIKRILNQKNHHKSTIMDKLSITLLLILSFFLFSIHSKSENLEEDLRTAQEKESTQENRTIDPISTTEIKDKIEQAKKHLNEDTDVLIPVALNEELLEEKIPEWGTSDELQIADLKAFAQLSRNNNNFALLYKSALDTIPTKKETQSDEDRKTIRIQTDGGTDISFQLDEDENYFVFKDGEILFNDSIGLKINQNLHSGLAIAKEQLKANGERLQELMDGEFLEKLNVKLQENRVRLDSVLRNVKFDWDEEKWAGFDMPNLQGIFDSIDIPDFQFDMDDFDVDFNFDHMMVDVNDALKKANKQLQIRMGEVEEALIKDGLVERGAEYELKFTNKELFVNGVAQPRALFRKYQNLITKDDKLDSNPGEIRMGKKSNVIITGKATGKTKKY